MTIKQFFKSKEKLAIHCNSEDKAKALLKAFDKAGYKWCDESRYTDTTCWYYYKEEICYGNNRTCADRERYQDSDFKILEFEDIEIYKISYGKREHRGGLNESLETAIEISEEEFKELLEDKNNGYEYYCYDDRCNQIIFLGNYELDYMFLYIQIN